MPMFEGLIDYLSSLFYSEAYQPWRIVVEMLMIGIVMYTVLRFLHGTRGAHLLQGLAILMVVGVLVVRVLAEQFGLERIEELYQPFVWTVLLTTLVVFQPELRRGLMRIGGTRWGRSRPSEVERIIRPIAAACRQLSKNKIGALIAIEREVGLTGLVDQGVKLEARLTPELLNTIFWPGSALHDLGVIIQRNRIAAASCPFPLADIDGYDISLGSRHRAAIGLSLDSDAVVIVVSEETGSISIAENGRLHRHIPADVFSKTLRRFLSAPSGDDADKASSPEIMPPADGSEVVDANPADQGDSDSNESSTNASGDKPVTKVFL